MFASADERIRPVGQGDHPGGMAVLAQLAEQVQIVLAGIGVVGHQQHDQGLPIDGRLGPVAKAGGGVVHGHHLAGGELQQLEGRLLGHPCRLPLPR